MVHTMFLAGGKVPRLQSGVSDEPKPIAPVAGRPLNFVLAAVGNTTRDGGVAMNHTLPDHIRRLGAFSFHFDIMFTHLDEIVPFDGLFIGIRVPENETRAQELLAP